MKRVLRKKPGSWEKTKPGIGSIFVSDHYDACNVVKKCPVVTFPLQHVHKACGGNSENI